MACTELSDPSQSLFADVRTDIPLVEPNPVYRVIGQVYGTPEIVGQGRHAQDPAAVCHQFPISLGRIGMEGEDIVHLVQ